MANTKPSDNDLEDMVNLDVLKDAIESMARQGSVDNGRLDVLRLGLPRVALARMLAAPWIAETSNMRSGGALQGADPSRAGRAEMYRAMAVFCLKCTKYPVTEREAAELIENTITAPSLDKYSCPPAELVTWQNASKEAFSAVCENSLLPYPSTRLVAQALDNKFRNIEGKTPGWGSSGLTWVRFLELPCAN